MQADRPASAPDASSITARRRIESGSVDSMVSNSGSRSSGERRFQLVWRKTSGFDRYAYHASRSARSSWRSDRPGKQERGGAAIFIGVRPYAA